MTLWTQQRTKGSEFLRCSRTHPLCMLVLCRTRTDKVYRSSSKSLWKAEPEHPRRKEQKSQERQNSLKQLFPFFFIQKHLLGDATEGMDGKHPGQRYHCAIVFAQERCPSCEDFKLTLPRSGNHTAKS